MLLMSQDKFVATSRSKLVADVEALLRPMTAAAKRRPIAKKLPVAAKPKAAPMPKPAKPEAPKPAAPAPKPKSRGVRLIEAERQVKAARPKDARLVWKNMTTK
jgi:hypothetical protein